jgi:AAA domain/Aldo/keto reductase family
VRFAERPGTDPDHGDLPDWAAAVGPSTLVIIDEAGMADTLSLDAAVQFAIGRGANVRLVGDNQQLAAIGAGGVLRDIQHTHGALRLTELHRFTNSAEAHATLALRDGDPKSLDFYLDQGRVHVGDIATTTGDAFAAWAADRAAGLDAIMLAPTRDLVAELNRRARSHRLNGNVPNAVVRLADGNQASVGDVIITRSNDRRLRLAATDWVKNGYRWTITHIGRHGELTVRHNRSHLMVRLPADYVRESTGLGYATTIHAAQGVSADTMHGLATGQESRQQLYTMLTRGRAANHVYLQVVGDGDPHSLIRPETVAPRTPTETLQQILTRDDTPTSATTLLRQLSDPAARLFDAVQRYTDSLLVAAEHLVGPQIVHTFDARADQVVPHLTNQPSWPTPAGTPAHPWRAETGEHPLLQLHIAAAGRELHTAADMAPCWTGASQNPHPLTQGRCHGFPAFQQRSMIILFGADIWRSGPNWSPTSPIRSEITPAKPKPSRCGRRRAAAPTSQSSVNSPCGGPPTASTPTTHDQPDQHICRQPQPSGSTTSTAASPTAVTTTSVLTSQSAAPLRPHVIADTKIEASWPNHPRSNRTRHPAPAYNPPMENQYNLLKREEEREMLPMCADMGVCCVPYSPLGKGRLARPWGQHTQRGDTDHVAKSSTSTSTSRSSRPSTR